MTGKQKFLIALVVIPTIIGIAAIGIKIKRSKTIERFEHPVVGQIYTTTIGNTFIYKRIKSISKDSITFNLSNYKGVRGDMLSDVLKKDDAFTQEEQSYSKTELLNMLNAKHGDNDIFNITDPVK
jgi:hypothetical protein